MLLRDLSFFFFFFVAREQWPRYLFSVCHEFRGFSQAFYMGGGIIYKVLFTYLTAGQDVSALQYSFAHHHGNTWQYRRFDIFVKNCFHSHLVNPLLDTHFFLTLFLLLSFFFFFFFVQTVCLTKSYNAQYSLY